MMRTLWPPRLQCSQRRTGGGSDQEDTSSTPPPGDAGLLSVYSITAVTATGPPVAPMLAMRSKIRSNGLKSAANGVPGGLRKRHFRSDFSSTGFSYSLSV